MDVVALFVGAILFAVYLLASVRRPQIVVAMCISLIFSNIFVNMSHEYGFAALAVAPYALMVPPGLTILAMDKRKVFFFPTPLVWLFSFIAWGVVSTVFSATPAKSTQEVISWALEGLVFIVLLINLIRDRQGLRLYIWVVVATAGIIGLLVTFEGLSGQHGLNYLGLMQNSEPYDVTGLSYSGLSGEGEDTHRSAGMIGETNYFAMYMSCTLPWAIYLAVSGRSLVRLQAIVLAVLILGGVLYSYSRGALVALALSLVILTMCGVLPKLTLVWGMLGGLVALLTNPTMALRMLNLVGLGEGVSSSSPDASSRGRASELIAASRAFMDNFVLGVGPGQFPDYYQHYGSDVAGGIHTAAGGRQAHNLILGLAAEVGIVGLVLFLAIIVTTIAGIVRSSGSHFKLLAAAAITSITIYLSASLFLHLSYARYLWLFLSFAIAIAIVEKNEEKSLAIPFTVARSKGSSLA